jgi:cytochrome c biogenesis protein CcmG, thiol:disulfide interchange protein DsbE
MGEQRRRKPLLRMLQVAALATVAGLLALLAWRIVDAGSGARLVSDVRAGERPLAPEFTLPVLWPRPETWPKAARAALDDGKVSPRELRGHPVVLNFWASWCAPCAAEAPRFRASARAHRGQVAFLGVDINDLASDACRFLRKYKIDYVAVRDGSASTESRYGLTGLPETYYLSADGRVVVHSPGEVSQQELEQSLRAIGVGG